MFIREVKKKNTANGKTFFQYQLVQAARIEGKVKQRIILYLGSDPLMRDKQMRKMVADLLQAMIYEKELLFARDYPEQVHQLAAWLYEKFLLRYRGMPIGQVLSLPPKGKNVQYEQVDVNTIETEEARTFGAEHLCVQVMEQLGLGGFLTSLGMSDKDSVLAQLSIISRALFTSSKYKTSSWLRDNSELKHLMGYDQGEDISHKSLYRIADKLFEQRERIDQWLYGRVSDLFNLKDTLVIYDLSNTHFEGRKEHSGIACFGKNKQKRDDCRQVVFSGVVNREGFFRHSRIYEGNKADVKTIDDMIEDLLRHTGPDVRDKIVVIDAAFGTDEVLKKIAARGLQYVCVSRSRPKHKKDADKPSVDISDKRGNKIALQFIEVENSTDKWLMVESARKRIKETSMSGKLESRFEQELEGLSKGLQKKGTTKRIEKVYERIGRIKQKHRIVSGRYTIEVSRKDGLATKVAWQKKAKPQGGDNGPGRYFIRSNATEAGERFIWDIYIVIREIEATFRCLKRELLLRPVYHQHDHRIESHIYLTILAYQLVNTIRYMLKIQGINHDWKNIVRIMNTQIISSVILNTNNKKISIRKPSNPFQQVQQIYKATGCKQTIPAKRKYVVYH